jgi:hypothetical protein
MNKYQIKSEVWETQVWIMWLLALGLYETEHYILSGFVIGWSVITVVWALIFAFVGKAKELEKEKLDMLK